MTFDFPSLINLVLSALIGVVTSWLIAHWYYLKNSPTERILKEIKSVLPTYFHPVIYPQFFRPESVAVIPNPLPPTDRDIPHIEYAVFSKRVIIDGEYVEVLFKLRDIGRNLENPSGVRVRDHNERNLAVKSIGLGFASTSFRADINPINQESVLTVTLRDSDGRTNTQSVPFTIDPR